MRHEFCFVCGKQTEELIDGMCSDCYEKNKKPKKIKLIDYLLCPRCGRIKFRGKWGKKEIGEGFNKIGEGICDDCSREKGGYYEAIIQIRGDHPHKFLRLVESTIQKSKAPRNFFTLKEVKGGYDFRIGNKVVISEIAKESKHMGAEIKRTYKIFARTDGRDVYRTTLLIRSSGIGE